MDRCCRKCKHSTYESNYIDNDIEYSAACKFDGHMIDYDEWDDEVECDKFEVFL